MKGSFWAGLISLAVVIMITPGVWAEELYESENITHITEAMLEDISLESDSLLNDMDIDGYLNFVDKYLANDVRISITIVNNGQRQVLRHNKQQYMRNVSENFKAVTYYEVTSKITGIDIKSDGQSAEVHYIVTDTMSNGEVTITVESASTANYEIRNGRLQVTRMKSEIYL